MFRLLNVPVQPVVLVVEFVRELHDLGSRSVGIRKRASFGHLEKAKN